MGMILSFVPKNSPAIQRAPGELASVIIFPGVRYERLAAITEAVAADLAVKLVELPNSQPPAH
jgi:hypothetical protein